MKERIIINEESLNKINDILNRLDILLDELEDTKEDLDSLNNYYGSKTWFNDKEKYENGKYNELNAGVLSEDAVWNMNEKITEIKERLINYEYRNN